MLILGIDSAGAGCGVCVWRDGTVLAEAEERMERGQDRRLMPLVLETMKKAGAAFDDLDRIAVTRGPGSFTGLRIGLAAARGIGLAAGKPVIGIDRFAVFRAQIAEPGGNLFVVINSKRKELFCRFYPAKGPAADPVMMTIEQIIAFLYEHENTTVTGDGMPPGTSTNARPPAENETITAAALAARADVNDLAFLPRPLYLRAPDVTLKKPKILIQPVSPIHAPLLADLHAASFGGAAWSLEQMQGSLMLDTTKGWLASGNGKTLGFILCQRTPERTEILTFSVRPEAQRQGIGERLLKQVVEAVHATGGGTVFLEVAADNQPARALYEKSGFRVSGKRPDYYRRNGPPVDAIFYERILAEQ